MSSMPKLVLPSPAKLNRFLHIVGRREEDGYHLIQTLFQILNYGDKLTFETNDSPIGDIKLTSNIPELVNRNNLVIKAARLLQKASGTSTGATIHLEKSLPVGGGIGGGSSNAATTLLGLNTLWDLGLKMEQLAELGLQLGADVPVFVRGCSAFAEGVGEILQPVTEPTKQQWFLVVIPNVSVDTTLMFKHEDLTRDTPPIDDFTAFDSAVQGHNDFEMLVRRLYPEVDKSLTLLNDLCGHRARMSGSGACVFAPFCSHEEAKVAQLKLQSIAAASSFIAEGVAVSPLHAALKQLGYEIPK